MKRQVCARAKLAEGEKLSRLGRYRKPESHSLKLSRVGYEDWIALEGERLTTSPFSQEAQHLLIKSPAHFDMEGVGASVDLHQNRVGDTGG